MYIHWHAPFHFLWLSFASFDPKSSLVELNPREGEHCLREEEILAAIKREGPSLALVMLSGAWRWYMYFSCEQKKTDRECKVLISIFNTLLPTNEYRCAILHGPVLWCPQHRGSCTWRGILRFICSSFRHFFALLPVLFTLDYLFLDLPFHLTFSSPLPHSPSLFFPREQWLALILLMLLATLRFVCTTGVSTLHAGAHTRCVTESERESSMCGKAVLNCLLPVPPHLMYFSGPSQSLMSLSSLSISL